jgi:hypothetical protein
MRENTWKTNTEILNIMYGWNLCNEINFVV